MRFSLPRLSELNRLDMLKFVGLFVAYYATAHIGLTISSLNQFASLIWPPSGIALAFLLVYGSRFWPSVFYAAFLVNFTHGAPAIVAIGIGAGNTLEALVAFWLCQTFQPNFKWSLNRLDDVITFTVRAAILSTLVSPFIGLLSLWIGGVIPASEIPVTFAQWWTGDAMGIFVVTPAILTFSAKQKIDRFMWKSGWFTEKALLCFVCGGLTWMILSGSYRAEMAPIIGLKGIYILVPLLLWTSMRFGQRGSTATTLAIAVLGLLYTMKGVGAFSEGTMDENLLHLVVFLLVVAITGLFVGAVATEREFERINLEQRTNELQRSEANLKRAKDVAEAANASKSAFLANMSHEIRTPLGAVLGFSDILLQPDTTESEKLKGAEIIRRNGRLLSNIVNDILDLSKVEAGKLEIEKRDISIDEIMIDFASLLSLGASERGIRLRLESEGALPDRIKTDPLRVRQILLNVVGNALKFTEHGSVEVLVKLVHGVDGPKLVFRVKDTGRGISPTQAARLFEPFSQADVSTTRKFGGTGLGLVLSKRLAQALGGDVKLIESKLGQGSTFTITIDPGTIGAVSIHDFEDHQNAEPLEKPARVPLTGLRVLVVDDSVDNQILITRLLQKAQATVETARNGRDAVDKALAGSFNVILMDLQMPEMDGYEATSILRSSGYKKPIIALTAHAMKDERRKCLESGFDDHLSKPIDYEILLKTLANYLPKADARQPSTELRPIEI